MESIIYFTFGYSLPFALLVIRISFIVNIFVAEAKFQEHPEEYSKLIREGNEEGIEQLLTNKAVENRLLRRVFVKASLYGADISDTSITKTDNNLTSFQVPEKYKIGPNEVRVLL